MRRVRKYQDFWYSFSKLSGRQISTHLPPSTDRFLYLTDAKNCFDFGKSGAHEEAMNVPENRPSLVTISVQNGVSPDMSDCPGFLSENFGRIPPDPCVSGGKHVILVRPWIVSVRNIAHFDLYFRLIFSRFLENCRLVPCF